MVERLPLKEEDRISGSGIIRQSVETGLFLWEHCHDFYELFYISHGKIIHCVNGEKQVLDGGSLILIRPDDVHSYEVLEFTDFEMYSLGFSREEMYRTAEFMDIDLQMIETSEMPIGIYLHGIDKTFLEQQLGAMLLARQNLNCRDHIRMLLSKVLFYLKDADWEAREHMPEWLSELDDQMSFPENYINGLPKMLELCMCSQEHLNRTLKKYFGLTPTEYINVKRIAYAMTLLVSRKYNVIDICYMSGFNSLSHFYAVFKKQYGCTPNQFLSKEGL